MAYPCCISPPRFFLFLFITKLFWLGLEKNKVEPVSFFHSLHTMKLLDGGKKVKPLSSLRPWRSQQPAKGILLQADVSGDLLPGQY